MGAVIRFLGYDPFAEPADLIERMHRFRVLRGWTCEQMAQALGVDPCTISSWERREPEPTGRSRSGESGDK